MVKLSPRLEQIFTKTKTVCFGRFLIEVPTTAAVVFGRMTVDFEIAYYRGEAGIVDERIAKHTLKLEKEDFLNKNMNTPGSLYGKILAGGDNQKTFVGANNDAYYIYSYIPVEANLFIFEVNSILTTKEVKQEIAKAESFARQLRARADDNIPAEPGICLEGGFINLNPQYENISMGVRLAEFPDVHLSISTLKNQDGVVESSSLENRIRAAEREAIQDGQGGLHKRIKFFRREPRQMGDWRGEEALARMPAEKGGFVSHQFQFYAVGEPNNILRPVVDMQLDTGVADNTTKARPPSVTDDEAVALWDRLTGSIRVRPTTPTATAQK